MTNCLGVDDVLLCRERETVFFFCYSCLGVVSSDSEMTLKAYTIDMFMIITSSARDDGERLPANLSVEL